MARLLAVGGRVVVAALGADTRRGCAVETRRFRRRRWAEAVFLSVILSPGESPAGSRCVAPVDSLAHAPRLELTDACRQCLVRAEDKRAAGAKSAREA
jgi:hypothetical protein